MPHPLINKALRAGTKAGRRGARQVPGLVDYEYDELVQLRNAALKDPSLMPEYERKAAELISRRTGQSLESLGYDPVKLGQDYPPNVPGGQKAWDNNKKRWYDARLESDEGKAMMSARERAQREIDKGNYSPLFPVDERYMVDPKNYPLKGTTIEATKAKKAETQAQRVMEVDTPEARRRLQEAYDKAKGSPLAHNFYAMGQLEQAFIDELGEAAGRKAFAEWARAMSATTAGADPRQNLMGAQYGLFQTQRGAHAAENSLDAPPPTGGRYLSTNLKNYNRGVGQDIDPAKNPKRHNFAGDFMGHTDLATIDEQMSDLFKEGWTSPAGGKTGGYSASESVIASLAKKNKTTPMNFQEVAWAGGKGYEGKPMIQEVNEAIERTSRITGKSPRQVLIDSIIKRTSPLYGVGAVSLMSNDIINLGEPTYD